MEMVRVPTSGTVSDYFLAAPAKYFKTFPEDVVSAAVRERLLRQTTSIVDTANGYILTSSIHPDLCNYVMAIFRRPRPRSYLVALSLSCTVEHTLHILDPSQGWKDVTEEVFPLAVKGIPLLNVELPRYGSTIEVSDFEGNAPVRKATFDGERFRLVK